MEEPIQLIAQQIHTDDPRKRALYPTEEGYEILSALVNAFTKSENKS